MAVNERQAERGQLRRLPRVLGLDDLLVEPEEPHRGSTISKKPIPREVPHAWPEYLDIATLARYTNLSEAMLRKLLRDSLNPLPSVMVGRARRFYRPAVDTWMAKRASESQGIDALLDDLRRREYARKTRKA